MVFEEVTVVIVPGWGTVTDSIDQKYKETYSLPTSLPVKPHLNPPRTLRKGSTTLKLSDSQESAATTSNSNYVACRALKGLEQRRPWIVYDYNLEFLIKLTALNL